METATTDNIKIDAIRTDGGTQARAGLDESKVQEYVEVMERDGVGNFPPLVVFYDGDTYWLADGFHRLAAMKLRKSFIFVRANVCQGTRRDAVLFACGANADHGLPRSADDKRRAVETLLSDQEWGAWSDREIARRCKVSHPFVAKIRSEIDTGNRYQYQSQERAFVHPKTGKETVMNTANIGGGIIYSGLTEEEIEIVSQVRGHSCVYITSNKGAYKIGYTNNLASRYTTTQKPPAVQLVHAFTCSGQGTEKKLHQLFANKRISGEWFELAGNDLEWLLSISDESEVDNAIIAANNEEFFRRYKQETIQHREDMADPDGRKPPSRCPRCHAGRSSILIASDHWQCRNCNREYDHTGKMPVVAETAEYTYTAEIEQYVEAVDAGTGEPKNLAIWELESATHAWLTSYFNSNIAQQHQAITRIKDGKDKTLLALLERHITYTSYASKSVTYRASDLKQAINNVCEQLRQRLEERERNAAVLDRDQAIGELRLYLENAEIELHRILKRHPIKEVSAAVTAVTLAIIPAVRELRRAARHGGGGEEEE